MTMNRTLLSSQLLTLVWLLVATGCAGVPVTPQPTATPTPPLEQRIEGAANNQLAVFETQQAEDLIMQRASARQTATQAVLSGTATEQVRQEQALATQRAESATQQAWMITVEAGQARDTATAQSQQTATQIAYGQATSTAQSQATATQLAVIGLTATVSAAGTATSVNMTQQAPIIEAERRALEAKTESTELKLKQEKATAFFWAWFAPCALVVGILAALFVIWKKSKVGVIQDQRGNVRIVLINGQALNPDLMFGPLIAFSKLGQAYAPDLGTSDADQRQVNHESKIVDAVQALPPGYPRQGMNLVGGMTSGAQQPSVNIQVLQPGQMNGLRRDFDEQLAGEVIDDD